MTDSALAARLDRTGRRRDLVTLLAALDAPTAGSTAELLGSLDDVLGHDPSRLWLALAVLRGSLPDEDTVLRTVRRARLDGARVALTPVLALGPVALARERFRPRARVEVRTDAVLVDVHHTSRTSLATGIQRVARHCAQVWTRDHDVVLVGWNSTLTALRELGPDEARRACQGGPAGAAPVEDVVVVPWRCRYLLPELVTEPERSAALLAMMRFATTSGAMIGFDCTPVSTAESAADGMAAGFASMLAALAWFDRVAAISEAAAGEYAGWREMLVGAGIPGPAVAAVPLATEPAAMVGTERPVEDLVEAGVLADRGLPLVLCVGSHEPRKNHGAVLAAAEVLWAEGLAFGLTFVGGNSWRSEAFVGAVTAAAARGMPVRTVTALPDDLLAAAYREARLTVFPSWNEGFGLPVAESLAAGTPVITSGFGSMAEIARHGGAVLVDPGDDASITGALRDLLTDDVLCRRLQAEARSFPIRTWDEYASECWEFMVRAPGVPEGGR